MNATVTPFEKPPLNFDDIVLVRLAREIAMDIQPLDEILKNHGLTQDDFEELKISARFNALLRANIEEWQSAVNTESRVRIKSMAFVEEALPEFFARAHDPKESLSAKVEVLKTVARFAGVGSSNVDGAVAGDRLSVTINLGADRQLRIERDITPRIVDEAPPQIEEDHL